MENGAAGVMIAPVPSLRTDDQITGYYRQAGEAIGADIPFVIQDYPLTLYGADDAESHPSDRPGVGGNPSRVTPAMKIWPGLEKISTLRAFQAEGPLRPISISDREWRTVPRLRNGARRRRRNDWLRLPDMLVELVKLQKAGKRDEAHDLFDAHLPLLRYEQQQGVGLAVRKYVMMEARVSGVGRPTQARFRACQRRRARRSITCCIAYSAR